MKKKMPRSKNGPRSNFSFLPFELRFRIIGMIQDGFTAGAIAAVPEVREAFSSLGSSFNRATMTRIKKSAEYKEISAKRSARKAAEYDAPSGRYNKGNGFWNSKIFQYRNTYNDG